MNITIGPAGCTQYFFEPTWVFVIGATIGFIAGIAFIIGITNWRKS